MPTALFPAKTIIFTDLDGTLLNEDYSFQEVRPTIDQLIALNIAIVPCSSKTRAEIEFYRKEMNLLDPFVSENGAAIFIPKNYFKSNYICHRQTETYDVIELGVSYDEIRQQFEIIKRKTRCKLVGFGDISVEEVARDSGLPFEMAKLAKQREYTEPFRIIEGATKEREMLFKIIRNMGLCVVKGDRHYHLSGDHNKGKAVTILKKLYAEDFEKITTFGVGNGPNDLTMLGVTDVPILAKKVEKPAETWKQLLIHVIDLNF